MLIAVFFLRCRVSTQFSRIGIRRWRRKNGLVFVFVFVVERMSQRDEDVVQIGQKINTAWGEYSSGTRRLSLREHCHRRLTIALSRERVVRVLGLIHVRLERLIAEWSAGNPRPVSSVWITLRPIEWARWGEEGARDAFIDHRRRSIVILLDSIVGKRFENLFAIVQVCRVHLCSRAEVTWSSIERVRPPSMNWIDWDYWWTAMKKSSCLNRINIRAKIDTERVSLDVR